MTLVGSIFAEISVRKSNPNNTLGAITSCAYD